MELFCFRTTIGVLNNAQVINSIGIIRDQLLDVMIELNGDVSPEMIHAYTFINHTLIEQLLKYKNYDKAKENLNTMIENEYDTDFAIEMLAKIEVLEKNSKEIVK